MRSAIVRYKVVEWAADVNKEGLPPSSSPPPSPAAAPSEASKALVKRCKNLDAGYNPVVEADEPEKILGCCVTAAKTMSVSRDRESFGTSS